MPGPLVETKLFLPISRDDVVRRPRLDRLRWPDRTRLTLVSAPAGFGKTTLLTSWLAGRRTAWVSLDETDSRSDPFWAYLLTAVERAAPGTGAAGLTLLGQVPIETVLAGVLNELSVLPEDLDLVLDDYHLADSPEIQPGMAFLVEHLPPQVRLTISTRADPALPLARLRARGELTEVRAADLRFTDEEVAAYLGDVAGLALAADDVAALAARTEGWVAAVQLAALSLQGREDASGFVAGFAGDDRYVVDYLVEEVLDRQPADVRDFLLETSILERLTGPLCDAVTGTANSSRMLTSLERQNLFVVPLDDHRRWYRYHHLFADVLRAHLLQERSGQVVELHRRASRWYDGDGDAVAAVRHALAAGDAEHAADLIERALPPLQRGRREDVIRGWVGALPDDVVGQRPVLAIGLVGGLMSSNEFDGVERRLEDLEQMLARPHDQLVVLDRRELARIPGEIAMYRAALALNSGDPAGTIRHAADALDVALVDDHLVRAAAAALAALASWTNGDLDAAHRGYLTALDGLQRAGHIADVLGCTIAVADLEITQGRLRAAQQTFERALRLVTPGLRGTADMYVGLAELAREQGDLDAAREHLRRSEDLGEEGGLAQNPYRWRVALAGLREADGDLAGAADLLEDAARVYVGDYSPDVRPVPSRLARVHAAGGDLAAARQWVRRQGLGPDDEPSYLHEHEHLTLARILLAERTASSLQDARQLLDRLLAAAEAGGRTGSVIEILVLQALARQAGGADGIPLLERALALGEPEGYARIFLGEGEPLQRLLATLAKRRPDWHYPQALLGKQPAPAPVMSQGLVDPLSERELEVLRLLASDLDGPSIARELVVSLNTVRTHTKHIYAKLGVNNRRAAVTQAHQRGLLTRSRRAQHPQDPHHIM